MKSQSTMFIGATIVLGTITSSASAGYLFSFEGTVTADNGTTNLVSSAFTLNMFVDDLATDLTASSNMGSYAISLAQMDIGSDGSIEESFTPGITNQAIYIDAGSTQLVGAFDLGGSFATFLFGVNIPTNAFTDPHSLNGQSSFMLSGLTSSSFSFYQSSDLNLVLNLTSFTFENNVAVVPLPLAGIAGLGLLGVLGVYRGTQS